MKTIKDIKKGQWYQAVDKSHIIYVKNVHDATKPDPRGEWGYMGPYKKLEDFSRISYTINQMNTLTSGTGQDSYDRVKDFLKNYTALTDKTLIKKQKEILKAEIQLKKDQKLVKVRVADFKAGLIKSMKKNGGTDFIAQDLKSYINELCTNFSDCLIHDAIAKFESVKEGKAKRNVGVFDKA